MTKPIYKLFAQSGAFALLLPGAAFAELSAAEVWEKWKSFAELGGQTITVGSQENNGGTLRLNDLTMALEFPDGTAASSLEFLEFRERGDGTVSITMAPDFPITFSIDPEAGDALDMGLIMRQSGVNVIASGEPDDISLDYRASEISLAVDKIIVGGNDLAADIQFSLSDVVGKSSLKSDDMMSYTSNFNAGKISYVVAFSDPIAGDQMHMTGSILDVATISSFDIPAGLDYSDPAVLFQSNVKMVASLTAGQTEGQMEMSDDGDRFSLVSSSTGSSLDFGTSDGSVQYGGAVQGVDYKFSSSMIPFPEVNVILSEMAFNLAMPLEETEAPADFAFLLNIAGLEISDMIWSMFDPGQIMPRDPATLTFDLTGKISILADLFDPEFSPEASGETPVEIHDLAIKNVTLSALGAKITGTGDFTFDNTDLETFDGFPAPAGSIDMNISGANGLMDRLIQMGFLQQDQAMGARMMLGLFARPGAGQDELTSNIEVKGDGSVFANGQQLR